MESGGIRDGVPIVLMQDVVSWAQQIYILIGILLAATVGVGLLLVVWTGAKIALLMYRQRRGREEYRRAFYRADGQHYPPYIEGICEACGRGHRQIFHPSDGPNQCPDCYEAHWRRATGWAGDSESRTTGA